MKIPEAVTTFIEAFNNHNSERMLASFADTALIHDEGHDYRGIAEIKKWYEQKVVGPNVTLEPIKAVETNGKTIITVIVDGNFDKTGLPDPLKLDFQFTIDATKVTGLSIDFPKNV
jgi:hypothetical protein